MKNILILFISLLFNFHSSQKYICKVEEREVIEDSLTTTKSFDEILNLLQGEWKFEKNIDDKGIERNILHEKFVGSNDFYESHYDMQTSYIVKNNIITSILNIPKSNFPETKESKKLVYLPNTRRIIRVSLDEDECNKGTNYFKIHKVSENELILFSYNYNENKEGVKYLLEVYKKVKK